MFRISRILAPSAATLLLVASLAHASSGAFQGYNWSTFGAATATAYGSDSLRVANIGSSGNDGVRITMPAPMHGDFDVEMKQLPMSATPVGSYLVASVLGVVNGVPGQPVATRSMLVTSNPSYPLRIRDDWSAVNADHYHYLGLAARNAVEDHTGAAGDTAAACFFSQKWVEGVTTLYVDGVNMGSDYSSGGWLPTQWPWSLRVANVNTVTSTPLSSSSLASVSAVSEISLRGASLSGFTLTSISVKSVPALPSATLPMVVFGGVLLLVGGAFALRRRTLLA